MLANAERFTLIRSNSTLFPFLYCTSTIQCSREPLPSASSQKRYSGRQRSGTIESRYRRPASVERTQSNPQDRAKIRRQPDIPFERPRPKKDPYSELELEGSTITPNERKAFEDLFSLQRRKPEAHEVSRQIRQRERTGDPWTQTGVSVREDAEKTWSADLSPALLALARQARARQNGVPTDDGRTSDTRFSSSPRIPEESVISEVARKELSKISKAISAASTDAEVWKTLETQVLKPAALQLQSFEARHTALETSEYSENDTITSALSILSTTDDKDLLHLQATLPTHLANIFKHLIKHYPASPLPLSILPALQRLSPSSLAVVVGASTELYNLHLRELSTRYGPVRLSDIVEVLKSSLGQSKVNSETLGALDDVLSYERDAGMGAHGESLRAFWQMDSTIRLIDAIADLRDEVKGKVEEAALSNAWWNEAGMESRHATV